MCVCVSAGQGGTERLVEISGLLLWALSPLNFLVFYYLILRI